MKKLILLLAPFAVTTVIFGTIYGAVQQALRLSANDPQIAIAQDIAEQLNQGKTPEEEIGRNVNVDKSLSVGIIISDKAGMPVATSTYISGTVVQVPIGVLQHSQNHAYHAITWQPQENVRLASVSTSANNYYVTAVRSLKEVEKRETLAMELIGIGWGLSMLGVAVPTLLSKRK